MAWASAVLAQGDLTPRQQSPGGTPDKSDEVPRLDDLLPPKSTDRGVPTVVGPGQPVPTPEANPQPA